MLEEVQKRKSKLESSTKVMALSSNLPHL
jgi:hypothetical protein